ncbi:hypothetical protein V8C43DRAFT_288371 [Trichoderma afarasin]
MIIISKYLGGNRLTDYTFIANMVADKVPQPTSRDEFEIAIVCTRALEYDAVCLLFDEFWDADGDSLGRARGDPNTYTTGCMGKYNIVVVLLCSSGKANAAGAAASLRSSYPCIELLLLTGICEGVPDANGEQLLLGDVVVSETVIEYDLGTQHVAGFKEKDTLEDRHGRANKNIRNFIANVKTEIGYQRIEDKAATFLEQIQSRSSETKYQRRRKAATYMYPGSFNDVLFESTHYHRHYNSSQCVCTDYHADEDLYAVCEHARNLSCEQTGCELSSLKIRDRLHQKSLLEDGGNLKSAQIPSIFFGRFGSGDTAFSSGIHRDSLAETHGIIAFEMEGAGIWDELPCIIVKGVNDYGDGHKTKKWAEWQNFAAATAASVARALIERYPQSDKPPVIDPKTDKPPAQLQENKACLDALFITNPIHDKKRIEDTKGGLLLDAYIWIIRNAAFLQWLEDPNTHLLWIKGDPGKGKTMLLCGVINELQTMKPGSDIYYFLCQATDIRLNNASAILRGLLHMMIVQQPSLISYIRDEYDQSGKSAFEGINSWVILSRIFERMLRDGSLNEPIFIIDALDECVTDLTHLLDMMVRNTQLSCPVKWLVSSRNEADIQEALAAAENKSTVSLELNAESVSTAIATYIRYKVQLLANKKGYVQHTRDRVERYLSDNASGTFLWVGLVCALLEKVPRSDPLPKSADFPPGLDQLYERMISRVCDSSISDIGRRVLAIATVAHRPLTKEELFPLINTGHHNEIIQPSEYDWEDMLGHCGSFLTMRSGTIYFVHQSAKDFLVKEGSQRLFPDGMEYFHREIFEVSIAFMRSILRKDMYNLVDPAFSIDNLSQHALRDDPLVPIKYGCVYWIDHFEQSITKVRKDTNGSSRSYELIHDFLKEKFIYWVEALSLLGGIFDGRVGMQRLEQLVADSKVSGILELVKDACKFIQTFGNAIADYPLQIYASALIFSPTRSIIRRQFKEQVPKWIQTLPDGKSEWDPSLKIYESSAWIEIIAISCCGTWIASSNSMDLITIWETYSGKNIQDLDAGQDVYEHNCHHSDKTLISFSPWNGEELVSSSCCEQQIHFQLIVWDVTTGTVSRQLRIEGWAASMSYLNSVRDTLGFLSYTAETEKDELGRSRRVSRTLIASIWNTKTGQMIKRVQLQKPSPRAWLSIFSPAGDNKIARCGGSGIEIIDIDTGSTVHFLLDKTSVISSMKFSPDGSFLVLNKWIRDEDFLLVVILLDTSSGEIIWSFRTKYRIYDFTFSPDGKLLAIATLKGIELLSTISGRCLWSILMSGDQLAFSSDGSKIFNAHRGSVNILDISQESFIRTNSDDGILERNTIDFRHNIHLSPNGRLVASEFSSRPFIEIMEIGPTNSTRFLKIPDLIQKTLLRLYFSPDSKKLVATSGDIIVLWDVSSTLAEIIFMCEKRSRRITSLNEFIFSVDSTRFAILLSHEDSFSVQVRDTESGNRLMHLTKGQKLLGGPSICISPDNGRLAISYLGDSTIRVEIWEIASNSAIQAIDLSWQDLHSNFRSSNPDINSGGSFDVEIQEDGEVPDQVKEEAKENNKEYMKAQIPYRIIRKVQFIERGHLILDLSEYDQDGIRVVLQTKRDPELTSNMIPFREARCYEASYFDPWIKFNGKGIVWIPRQYHQDAVYTAQASVVISHLRGPPSIIQFCHSELLKQIPPPHTSIMENTPLVPDTERFTYLQELGDDWKILYRDMSEPDDKVMHKVESVDEIKDTPEESAQEGIVENYSYWKWTVLGF